MLLSSRVRVCVENVPDNGRVGSLSWLIDRLAREFGGVTAWEAWGVWEGGVESSVVIESVAVGRPVDAVESVVRPLCGIVAQELGQDAVLLTVESVTGAELVGPASSEEGIAR